MPYLGRSVDSTWKSLPLRLEQIAHDKGELVAVRDGFGQSLTYKQLDARISVISSKLSSLGVESGSVIAVLQEPTIDWAVSVLAILRMNHVYVPLDTHSPLQRLSAIVQDSKPVVILTLRDTLQLAQRLENSAGTRIIAVDDLAIKDITCYVTHTDVEACHDRTSFILYTSGSSGVPKGVLLKHSNLLNQIENTVEFYRLEPGWTVLQQTAYSFDISLWQLLIATTSGASLYIVPQQLRGDALALSRIIADENINITGGTPSQYSSWLRHGDRDAIRRSKWHVVNCGGEALTPALQAEFRDLGKPDLRLYNAYAPCEATFVSNEIEIDYHNLDDSHKSLDTPVGYSLPNYAVYILDEQLNPVPAGAKGQIAIGGAGVAAGYLDSRLGDKFFVHNPYASKRDIRKGWTTMYLTGDEGLLRPDGALVFVSRRLSQNEVKLRGMRFNLNDIEANLVQAAGGVLAQAVASVRGSGDAQFLVAHVTFGNGRAPEDKTALFRRLLDELPVPGHMKPAMLLDIDALPLTVNSKIDRAAVQQLPLPEFPQTSPQDHELTGMESKIRELWNKILPAELLNLKPVGPDSDFFNVGGNSLLLVKLQAEINKCFGSLIPLIQLFEVPTVRGIASRLTGGERFDGAGPIDWEAETSLSLSGPALTVPVDLPVRRVVLTGATGFLGRAIVAQLLEQPSVERIDCVAVRDKPSRPLPPILASSPRVHIHVGDLTQPDLGLPAPTASAIFSAADAVIHNAAEVSFMQSYHSLRASNVGGTRSLLRLVAAHAAPRRVPIHFVSSAGVAQLAGGGALGEVSVGSRRPPVDGSNGYVAAKWASERLLEGAHARLGVPVWVHRPSSIMGEGAPDTDLMANLLSYSLRLRALPMLPGESERAGAEAFLDFVDVQTTAAGIVRRVVAFDGSGSGAEGRHVDGADPVRYEYHSGEYIIPLNALLQAPGEKAEEYEDLIDKFDLLPLADWIARAKEAGLNELVVALLDTALSRETGLGDWAIFPRLVKG
jgi:hybrid polyketide synthase / nonribosomal peptide synthetase ACE1